MIYAFCDCGCYCFEVELDSLLLVDFEIFKLHCLLRRYLKFGEDCILKIVFLLFCFKKPKGVWREAPIIWIDEQKVQ